MTQKEYQELLQSMMKAFNQKKPDIPARILDSSNDHIVKVYAEAYKQLYEFLIDALTDNFNEFSNPSTQTTMALMNQVEQRLQQLNADVSAQVKGAIEESYLSAKVIHTLATETVKTIEELQGAVPFSAINTYKAQQLVQDTMDDLLFATQHTSKEVKKVIRGTFAKHMQLQGLQNTSNREIRQKILKELSKQGISKTVSEQGFVGIIDKAGRRWNTRTYVTMAVQTKTHQAYSEGLKDRAIETGKDLALIPEKGATDSCKYFEGIVISMTGATTGFMTYDQLKSTGLIFHPHCRHNCFPIRSIEALHEDDVAFHKKQEAKAKAFMGKSGKSKKK